MQNRAFGQPSTDHPQHYSQGLRVLHHSTWNIPCANATYTAELVRCLDQLGIVNEVYAVDRHRLSTMSPRDSRKEMAELCKRAKDFDIVHFQHEYSFLSAKGDPYEANTNFVWALKQLVSQGNAVVASMHSEPYFYFTHKKGIKGQVKVLLLTGRYPWHGWTVGKVVRKHHKRIRLITHTDYTKANFAYTGIPSEYIHTIPIGFPELHTRPMEMARAEAKRKLGFPPDCVLLSLFGFITCNKGPDVAAKALVHLPDNYYLAYVGGQHPENRVDKPINEVLTIWHKAGKNPDRLRITGYVSQEEIDLYHAATDICLAPYRDHFSFSASSAISWALTSGKPVIATNIPAFRDINQKSECMILCVPTAEMELAWQIQRLTKSPDLQRRLVENSKNYAAQHTWLEIAKRTASIYREIVPARRIESSDCRSQLQSHPSSTSAA
jgi:glycosyltransferase involved in cell wall biosynthesis